MSEARVRELEQEVIRLRRLVHVGTEKLVAEAEARGIKKLKRAKKTLLLVCHPDKCGGSSRKELSEHFTRAVNQIFKP